MKIKTSEQKGETLNDADKLFGLLVAALVAQ